MAENVGNHQSLNGFITLKLFLFGILPLWFASLTAPLAVVTWLIDRHEGRPHVGAVRSADIGRIEAELVRIKKDHAAIRNQQTQILLEIAALRGP